MLKQSLGANEIGQYASKTISLNIKKIEKNEKNLLNYHPDERNMLWPNSNPTEQSLCKN